VGFRSLEVLWGAEGFGIIAPQLAFPLEEVTCLLLLHLPFHLEGFYVASLWFCVWRQGCLQSSLA